MNAADGSAVGHADARVGILRDSPSFDPDAPIPTGRSVIRFSEELRVHPALEELGFIGVVGEVSESARFTSQAVLEPILITKDGIILAGLERWRVAQSAGRQQLECIEYSIGDGDSLPFILAYHRGRRGWNPFLRICLALKMEPHLQQKALDNMCAGGKYKGSAKLPDLQHIDVREEIATAAAVCARNVSKVKKILKLAHPRLIEALRDGTLTINRAMQFCEYPKSEQLEQFTQSCEKRAISKIIAQAVIQGKAEETLPNARELLDSLRAQELNQPGSVLVLVGRLQRTVILIGKDSLKGPHSQGELRLT